jgi:organic radical activating enzyme
MDENFYKELIDYMKPKEWQFDNINLLGGEPLDNSKQDILSFCKIMKQYFPDKKFYIYTHYELKDIDNDIKQQFDYIKTGKFDKSKYSDEYYSSGINLKSINQKMNKKGIDY